ncbi:hypothetical protein CRE_12331 [Caenorhabditis remanei]|uniref:Uncharacterized protein n=1 Tax=Caenorhabditis remanei TaxID=31234 RepID=E3NIK3_CAERE|nr:hypothetical protein CRE_12331 [Caenorhabditis remanei]
MSSQEPTISNFLNGKPSIAPVEQSALLSRLRTFLPQLAQANENMPAESTADAFQIENVEEESSDDSSDEDSDAEDVTEESTEKAEVSQRIEIDLDVFKEKNSTVDGRDVSVQNVESLPVAFQSKPEELPKKPLIEEL